MDVAQKCDQVSAIENLIRQAGRRWDVALAEFGAGEVEQSEPQAAIASLRSLVDGLSARLAAVAVSVDA